MALVSLSPPADLPPLRSDVAEFVLESERRIAEYMDGATSHSTFAFVPSDFAAAYGALAWIREYALAPGDLFLEWGCGFGVVAALADALGFRSHGIEIDPELVANGKRLARDFRRAPSLVEGTFVPPGAERFIDMPGEHAWLAGGGLDGYDALGMEPDDFDVIYAYPWPGEEHIIERLFDRCAASGALLVTFRGVEGVRVHRKRPRRRAIDR